MLAAPDNDGDSDAEIDEVVLNTPDRSYPTLSLFNANARSLGPKIASLVVAFEELGLNAAIVSETWMQEDSEMSEISMELSAGHGLKMILRNRVQTASNGRKYGGVAIITDTNKASFKEFLLHNPAEFEVLAATAKIKGVAG